MIFWCPQCKQKYEGDSEYYQGVTFKCHICEFKFIVPYEKTPKAPIIEKNYKPKTKAIENIIASFAKKEDTEVI